MRDCLTHPEYGYYQKKTVFGAKGRRLIERPKSNQFFLTEKNHNRRFHDFGGVLLHFFHSDWDLGAAQLAFVGKPEKTYPGTLSLSVSFGCFCNLRPFN